MMIDVPFSGRLSSGKYFQFIAGLAEELQVKVYLAGGGLRDCLLGRRSKDLDFALAGSPEEIPRLFAARAGGSFFWLDRDRLQSRVVVRTEEGVLTFDFAPLRGMNITDDLSRRDFTINAMALELTVESPLIDPFHGEEDLRNGLIRKCSGTSFLDDPLRLLRGIRLAAVLGFTIEAGTLAEIREKAPLLDRVAAERIRGELMLVLESPGLAGSLQMLYDTGLLTVILPEGSLEKVTESIISKRIDAAIRVEEIVAELIRCFPDQFQKLAFHLSREIEGGVTALTLVKLAAFAGGRESKISADDWTGTLRMGRRAARMLAVLDDDMSGYFMDMSTRVTPRMRYRFFRDFEPAGVELALLALVRGEVSQSLCADLLNYYFNEFDPAADDLLLLGEEVMEMLGSGSGPAVGEALERLRVGERHGLVNSREEAREFILKKMLTNKESMR
jgi:poly(A) polymerase